MSERVIDKSARRRAIQRQIERLERRLRHLRRRNDQLTTIRLLAFLGGFAVSVVALFAWGVWVWLPVSAVAALPFIVAVIVHRRLERGINRYARWLALKQTHLARMKLDWAHIPAAPAIPLSQEHPFALDLDLVGERSVHQLLDTAVTHEGSRRLADWLLETVPDAARLAAQQAVVRELAGLPLFRDKLNLQARQAAETPGEERWPGQRLLDWLAVHSSAPNLRPTLVALFLLAPVNVALLLLDWGGLLPPLWPISWLIYALLSLRHARAVAPLFQDAAFLADRLRQLGSVFHFLEGYRYGRYPHLRQVCAPFLAAQRPSRQLRQAQRVVAAAGLRYNPVVAFLLNALVPWDLYFAWRMAQNQRALASLLPAWLDVWYELEAFSSLATFAYLNPAAVFPTVVDDSAANFSAVALGHPLIPDDQRVCNDFHTGDLGAIYIITGSNMAGKSSFLRAIGVNLCLAYAGGVVIAESLQTALFRLYAVIRVNDSVTDGYSFFYAEVRRLRALLGELERPSPRPLFFLIDEIFRGTNNRERLIGSRAYIKALAGGNGVGLIATHDLELVKLADALPLVANYHFRDEVVDGRMVFDYKLHPGPSPTTNALKIMRLAGLPVPAEGSGGDTE
jgi:hypothetical protein